MVNFKWTIQVSSNCSFWMSHTWFWKIIIYSNQEIKSAFSKKCTNLLMFHLTLSYRIQTTVVMFQSWQWGRRLAWNILCKFKKCNHTLNERSTRQFLRNDSLVKYHTDASLNSIGFLKIQLKVKLPTVLEINGTYIWKYSKWALAGWISWVERRPVHQKAAGSIPVQGHAGLIPGQGMGGNRFLFLSFPFCLKAINLSPKDNPGKD